MAKVNPLKQLQGLGFSQKKKDPSLCSIENSKQLEFSSLSQTLLKQGKLCLLNGDKRGIQCFEMAAKLDSENYDLFIEQGLALFECGSLEESDVELKLASKRFKMATQLNPNAFEGWYFWGNTLYSLGKKTGQHHYFIEALKRYQKAISLSTKESPEILATLYWNLGDLWNHLAKKSGEMSDYHFSIEAYQKASLFQEKFPLEFWINFANRYETIGKKVNNIRFFAEAIDCLKKAISIKTSFSDGWFFLGKTLKTLYSYTHDEDHFNQANDCFRAASKLSKNCVKISLEWARLFLDSGALFKDSKKIQVSLDLCIQAFNPKQKDPELIAIWVEALALFGSYTEQLQPIHEGLEKIESLVEETQTPELFYSHGMCLYALGSYYEDLDYYYQALEKFQEGLSLSRTHERLWRGMAFSSFHAALIDRNEKNYRRSLYFFGQALYFDQSSVSQANYALCLLRYGEVSQEKEMIELAVTHFEEALSLQKNAYYVHLDWIFYYASALDQLAHFSQNDSHYIKAINLLSHILSLKPEFPKIHSQLASTYSHYGESTGRFEIFERALHHFQIAHQQEKENDQILLEWGLTLLNVGDLLENEEEGKERLKEGEYKMIQAAKLGNSHAYYGLACLYSVVRDVKKSLDFLEKARTFDALPLIEEMLEDDWLENLRQTKEFQSFIKKLESRFGKS